MICGNNKITSDLIVLPFGESQIIQEHLSAVEFRWKFDIDILISDRCGC